MRSQVPVLILSGGLDPATGVHLGAEVARHLPRSRHLVIADAAHSPFGMKGQECVPQLFAEFIARGSAEGLDVSGLDAMSRPPFLLERPGLAPGWLLALAALALLLAGAALFLLRLLRRRRGPAGTGQRADQPGGAAPGRS